MIFQLLIQENDSYYDESGCPQTYPENQGLFAGGNVKSAIKRELFKDKMATCHDQCIKQKKIKKKGRIKHKGVRCTKGEGGEKRKLKGQRERTAELNHDK